MSFGMIFSIILIIAFIAFAFYAITKFLDWEEYGQIGLFVDDIQNDIDKMWQSDQGQKSYEYKLPKNVEQVCFKEGKIYFKPFGTGQDFDYRKIEHLETLDLCIDVVDGKAKIAIKKDFGESLVSIENVA